MSTIRLARNFMISLFHVRNIAPIKIRYNVSYTSFREPMCVTRPSLKSGNSHANLIEGTAVSASLLCLVHCLALPLLLLLLPGVIGLFVRSEAFHFAALALVAPAAFAAFWLGYRQHRIRRPALFGAAGVGCLAIALLPGIGESVEVGVTVLGSLLLLVGHMLNWRLRAHAS